MCAKIKKVNWKTGSTVVNTPLPEEEPTTSAKTTFATTRSPVVNILLPEEEPAKVTPSDFRPWYWEGHIQSQLVSHLVRQGFSIRSVSDTATRIQGKDIVAVTPDGKELWVSVKGFPESSANTQARHWFAGAIFDLILYRNENPDVHLALAFPDGFTTYSGLSSRVTWLRDTMPFKIYWVNEAGEVRVE